MRRTKGFSLIELMIAIAIVGILAGIAYPAYTDYVQRSKISEAVANLSDMRTKLEQFFLDRRTYVGACAANTVAPKPSGGAAKYFTYDCNLTATAYTVTATGVGDMADFIYQIDQANTRTTVKVPESRGWVLPTTSCWALRKDGSC